jgi:alkanesulfonate monooxygenase SsuD/methylene tetrahydromethanopterin reductase-like flavin-dependent oxidoreductase (luciferase family)
VGTPEQVAEKIRRYAEMGCGGVVPWCADYPDDTSLRLFAEQVIPELR